MSSAIEDLLEELKGIREHLAGLQAVADRYLHNHVFDRLDGNRNLLEMHQLEFDKQARRWRILQGMTPEEYAEYSMGVLERFGQRSRD
jgi:hypothetical protein